MTTDLPAEPVPGRRRALVFSLGVVLVLLVSLAVVAAGRSGEVELSIRLAKDRVLQGEELAMTLTVDNVSEHGVTADRWRSVAAGECRGASGLPLTLTLYYEPLGPRPAMQLPPEPGNLGTGVLEPGEEMALSCDLVELFNLVKPGEYTLEASYLRDRWAARDYLRLPARLWSSLVVHDSVRFKVIARPYDDPAKM